MTLKLRDSVAPPPAPSTAVPMRVPEALRSSNIMSMLLLVATTLTVTDDAPAGAVMTQKSMSPAVRVPLPEVLT